VNTAGRAKGLTEIIVLPWVWFPSWGKSLAATGPQNPLTYFGSFRVDLAVGL
jgi:hypothetical protein